MKFLIVYILLLLVPISLIISGIWSMISLNRTNTELRSKLATIQKLSQSLIYMSVKKPQVSFTLNNLQLVEIVPINFIPIDNPPNQIILVIQISSSSSISYNIELLDQLLGKKAQYQANFGLYVIRQIKRFEHNNLKIITEFVQQINQIIKYFYNILLKHKKRITIVAYQQSTLLMLRALAIDKTIKYQIFNKIVFVNLLNPLNILNQLSLVDYLKQLSYLFLKSPERLSDLNKTKIIHIDTLNYAGNRFDHLALDGMDWFIDSKKVRKLSHSVYIHSRMIKNVFSLHGQYFPFDNFYNTLANFLIKDISKNFSISQIYGYFHHQSNLRQEKISNITINCFPIDLGQQMKLISHQLIQSHKNCILLSNIQTYRPLMIKSSEQFQIYDNEYYKIQPFDNRTNVTYYLLQEIQFSKKFYIVNPKRHKIQIQFIQKYSPKKNPLPFYPSLPCLITICPGYSLLYPLHFTHSFAIQLLFLQQIVGRNQQCYKDINNYDLYFYEIQLNSNILINLVLFSLFCSQISRIRIIYRLHRQMLMNVLLWNCNGGSMGCILIGCIIVMVLTIIIEYCINKFAFVCTVMNVVIGIQKKLLQKLVWLPILTQLIRYTISFDYPLIGIILMIIIPFVITKESIIILVLKLYTNCNMLVKLQGNLSQLLLLTVWLSINLKSTEEMLQKRIKAKLSFQNAEKFQIMERLKFSQIISKKEKNIYQNILDGSLIFLMSFFIGGDQIKIDKIISSYVFGCVVIYIFQSNK